MGLPVGQHAANPDNEYRPELPGDHVLPLPRREVWILLLQLLGMNEGDLVRKHRDNAGMVLVNDEFGPFDDRVNLADNGFQVVQGPLLRKNDFLPVPLVNINGVDVVQLLVGPQCIHVGVNPVAVGDPVIGQHHPLPFGKRVNDLRHGPFHIPDLKRNRPFGTVQVIVDPGPALDEKGGGHPPELQFGRQVQFEEILDHFDGPFGLLQAQDGTVAGGDGQFHGDRFAGNSDLQITELKTRNQNGDKEVKGHRPGRAQVGQ